jgi:hypothetical protein
MVATATPEVSKLQKGIDADDAREREIGTEMRQVNDQLAIGGSPQLAGRMNELRSELADLRARRLERRRRVELAEAEAKRKREAAYFASDEFHALARAYLEAEAPRLAALLRFTQSMEKAGVYGKAIPRLPVPIIGRLEVIPWLRWELRAGRLTKEDIPAPLLELLEGGRR